MRDLFPGYFRKRPEEIKKIWSTCIFAFDAYVLLNLYRYSPTTSNSLLSVITALKNRVWVPWQAAHEFHNRRLDVIDKQTRAYENAVKSAQSLLKTLENPREHPFIEDLLQQDVTSVIVRLTDVLNANQKKRRGMMQSDPLLDQIAEIFSGRVGLKPNQETHQQRIKDSELRCVNRIPPGFRDSKKEGERAYGDVLIWFELMEHAKNQKKPLIFITDDSKNDWWLEVSGQTIGPLPELVEEFTHKTSQDFLLYRPDRFTEYAGTFINHAVTPSVVEEIRSRTEATKNRRKRVFDTEEARHLDDLCRHLFRHRKYAEVLVSTIESLKQSDWENANDEFEKLPEETRNLIISSIDKCHCLYGLLDALNSVSHQGFSSGFSEIEEKTPKDASNLLHRFRRIPDKLVDGLRRESRRREKSRDAGRDIAE